MGPLRNPLDLRGIIQEFFSPLGLQDRNEKRRGPFFQILFFIAVVAVAVVAVAVAGSSSPFFHFNEHPFLFFLGHTRIHYFIQGSPSLAIGKKWVGTIGEEIEKDIIMICPAVCLHMSYTHMKMSRSSTIGSIIHICSILYQSYQQTHSDVM